MVVFDRMPSIYWNDIVRASYLQRYILVHSVLYYQMSESVIFDPQYDEAAKQLVSMLKKMSEDRRARTQYWYCFKDFNEHTGYYLYDMLKEKDKQRIVIVANTVLKNYKMGGYKNVSKC